MLAKINQVSDSELSQAVLSQIRQNPALAQADVNVLADRGVVTLTGSVDNNSVRAAIEAAAKEVWGVQAIASDVWVRPEQERTDTEIARDILTAFRGQYCIPTGDITTIVREGYVSLEGKVHWEYQRMLAEATVKRLRGIKGINNSITVEPGRSTAEMKGEIEIRAKAGQLENPEDTAAASTLETVETGEAEAG
jgi:osmotically-inducible protein OsmY